MLTRILRIFILPLLLTLLFLFLWPPFPTNPKEIIPKRPLSLSFSKTEISPGDYFVLYLENLQRNDEVNLHTELVAKTPPLMNYKNGSVSVFAVNYHTKPGEYPLTIEIKREGRVIFTSEQKISLLHKDFKTQYLRVTARQLANRTEDLAKEDAIHVAEAKSVSSNHPLWEGPFIMPVEGRISTEYGLVRYINNVESGRHAGIDIATPRGTPVKAANSGIVTLSLPLNVSGNTVIIDHGMNFYSAYSHLDVLSVLEGQKVEKGDVIGEVGSTGFSTGPHLHWTISSGSTFTNPWLFLVEDPLAWLDSPPAT